MYPISLLPRANTEKNCTQALFSSICGKLPGPMKEPGLLSAPSSAPHWLRGTKKRDRFRGSQREGAEGELAPRPPFSCQASSSSRTSGLSPSTVLQQEGDTPISFHPCVEMLSHGLLINHHKRWHKTIWIRHLVGQCLGKHSFAELRWKENLSSGLPG